MSKYRTFELRAPSFFNARIRAPLKPSSEPLSFFGDVDTTKGEVVNPDHPLRGKNIVGTILVLPHGRGSTVGSYIIYALSKRGLAPAAIVAVRPDTVTLVGCVIAGIPYAYGAPMELLDPGLEGVLAELVVSEGKAILRIPAEVIQ